MDDDYSFTCSVSRLGVAKKFINIENSELYLDIGALVRVAPKEENKPYRSCCRYANELNRRTIEIRRQLCSWPEQVQPMITEALEHDGPALVEVLVSRQELAMPPTISLEQMTGFSLFMLKAVLSGRGGEIIDLAKINLLR